MLPRLIRIPGRSKPTVVALGIEPQVLPAGPGPGLGQRLGVGNALRPPDEAPGFRECARRHVVGPAGLPAELDGPLEQAEESRLDRDRPRWAVAFSRLTSESSG